jgi:hypothetical protein
MKQVPVVMMGWGDVRYCFAMAILVIIILDSGVTSHNVIDQSKIINFEMKKIFGGEAKQNPRDST